MALALFLSTELTAQLNAGKFYTKHLQIQNTGMYILGSWAVENIATGAHGWSRFKGDTKYFHQMNLFWNTVNLGIAGFAIHHNIQVHPLTIGSEEALAEARNLEEILLINSGLDLGYIWYRFSIKASGLRFGKA